MGFQPIDYTSKRSLVEILVSLRLIPGTSLCAFTIRKCALDPAEKRTINLIRLSLQEGAVVTKWRVE